jgi:hypothetical protein
MSNRSNRSPYLSSHGLTTSNGRNIRRSAASAEGDGDATADVRVAWEAQAAARGCKATIAGGHEGSASHGREAKAACAAEAAKQVAVAAAALRTGEGVAG